MSQKDKLFYQGFNESSFYFFTKIFLFLLFSFLLSPQIFSEIKINKSNDFVMFRDINTGLNRDRMQVHRYQWGSYIMNKDSSLIRNIQNNTLLTDQEVKLLSQPLFYPSPFRVASGTTLGYRINQDALVELRIFDIRGNELFRELHNAYLGYNKISYSSAKFNFPAGAYLFLIFSQGHLLASGKFAVLP